MVENIPILVDKRGDGIKIHIYENYLIIFCFLFDGSNILFFNPKVNIRLE